MAAGVIVVPSLFPARDRNNRLVAGALLEVRVDLSTIKAPIYTDSTLTTPLANPVTANASGVFPLVWAEAGTEEEPVLYTIAISGPGGASIANPSVFSGWRPSVDADTASVSLSEGFASLAEYYAAIAEAAAGPLVGSGLEFGPYTGDGTDTTFTMAQAVQAGNEFTVNVYVAGVLQYPDEYTCEGTTTLTFAVAPALGAIIEGVHVAQSVGVSLTPAPARTVPGGPLLSTTERAVRSLDLGDAPNINKASSDDGPGLAAAFAYASVWNHASGVVRINTNTTIVGDLLNVTEGQFYIASGVTLDLSGVEFTAPLKANVFAGPGTVTGLKSASVYWFGAVADWDEAVAGGGAYTDDTDAFNKAIAASQIVYGTDGAHGIDGTVLMEPVLSKSCAIDGAGTSIASAGMRLYLNGGPVTVSGTLGLADPSSNAEWFIRNLTILPGASPPTTGLQIAGEGGVTNKILTSLTCNLLENVTVGEFAINIAIRSALKIRLRNVRSDSQTTAGVSLQIALTTGGTVCADIDIEGCILSQPLGSAGIGLSIDNSDVSVGSAASADVRGITVDDNTQIYAGLGTAVVLFCQASPSKARTLGDVTFAPGTKFQGTGSISSAGLLYADAKDGGKISSIKALGSQFESSSGTAVDFRITTSGAVFGTIHDVHICDNHFRYHKNRSITFEGVTGYTVKDNHLQFCGATVGATAVEHLYFNNTRVGRIADSLTSESDADSWVGLATGITVTGAATDNVTTRGNAMGTATAVTYADTYPQSGDSADQPSIVAQV